MLLLAGILSNAGLPARIRIVFSKLLERLASRLLDAERSEDAEEHEEREYLQNVVEPRVGVGLGGTASAQRSNGTLANDGTNLAHGGRETMRSGPVAGGETLSRNNKGSSVGAWKNKKLAMKEDGRRA